MDQSVVGRCRQEQNKSQVGRIRFPAQVGCHVDVPRIAERMLFIARYPTHARIHGCGACNANAGAFQHVGPFRESAVAQAGVTRAMGGRARGRLAADPNEYG